MEEKDINKENNNIFNDKEKTLERLSNLQKMVKRESILKELCKLYFINNIH